MKISERIPHNGGPMPVPGDTKVLVEHRDGVNELEKGYDTSPASYWDDEDPERNNWTDTGPDGIVAYWVVTDDA